MSEALILPPTGPDLPGLVIISGERTRAVHEFGELATSLIDDPMAVRNGLPGQTIIRQVVSADDPTTTLQTRIIRLDEKNLKDIITASELKGAKKDFEQIVRNDPTLQTVQFDRVQLRVKDADVEMSCEIHKNNLASVDFNDSFFQYLLGHFRRHIAARGTIKY